MTLRHVLLATMMCSVACTATEATRPPPAAPKPPPPVVPAPAPAAPPSAESIAAARALVDAAVTAHGGLDRLAALTWFKWSGQWSTDWAMARYTRIIYLPERLYLETFGRTHTGHIFGSTISLVGNRAFKHVTAADMEADENKFVQLGDDAVAELKRDVRNQLLLVLVRAASPSSKLSLVEGNTACARLDEGQNEVRTLCFDPITHLLVRIVDQTIGDTIDASSFTAVNGIQLPFREVVTDKSGSTEFTFGTVRAEPTQPADERTPGP